MTPKEQAKIIFADASINLEIAQGKYNEARAFLVQELNKKEPLSPSTPPNIKEAGKKQEVK